MGHAKRIKNMSELSMSDLNFGMYKQDIVTAKMIREIQDSANYGAPHLQTALRTMACFESIHRIELRCDHKRVVARVHSGLEHGDEFSRHCGGFPKHTLVVDAAHLDDVLRIPAEG